MTQDDVKKNFQVVYERGQAIETLARSSGWKIVKTMLEAELDSLKYAYDCDSLQELKAMKKYRKGLLFAKEKIQELINAGHIAKEELDRWFNRTARRQ